MVIDVLLCGILAYLYSSRGACGGGGGGGGGDVSGAGCGRGCFQPT